MFVLGPNKDIKYHRIQGCGSALISQVFRNAYNVNVSNNKIKPVEVCVIRDPWKRLLCLFGQYKNQWTLDTSLTIDWDHHIWLPQYKRRWHNTNIVYFKYNTKL